MYSSNTIIFSVDCPDQEAKNESLQIKETTKTLSSIEKMELKGQKLDNYLNNFYLHNKNKNKETQKILFRIVEPQKEYLKDFIYVIYIDSYGKLSEFHDEKENVLDFFEGYENFNKNIDELPIVQYSMFLNRLRMIDLNLTDIPSIIKEYNERYSLDTELLKQAITNNPDLIFILLGEDNESCTDTYIREQILDEYDVAKEECECDKEIQLNKKKRKPGF